MSDTNVKDKEGHDMDSNHDDQSRDNKFVDDNNDVDGEDISDDAQKQHAYNLRDIDEINYKDFHNIGEK